MQGRVEQEAELDTEDDSLVLVASPDTDGAGSALEAAEVDDLREQARLRVGATLRDKTLAIAEAVKRVQVKLTSETEKLVAARAKCLTVRKAILLKKEELHSLQLEELICREWRLSSKRESPA